MSKIMKEDKIDQKFKEKIEDAELEEDVKITND